MTRHPYLVAYDITEPRRLNRVAKYLTRCAIRVQYSVFAAEWSRRALAHHLRQLQSRIDPKTDDVRVYPLPRQGEVALRGRQLFPEAIIVLHNGYNLLQFQTVPLPRTDTEEGGKSLPKV